MNRTPNQLSSSNNVDPRWANLGADTNFVEENPDTQTIFFPTEEVTNANETLQAQIEKEKRIREQGAKIVESFATGVHVAKIKTPTANHQDFLAFYDRINTGDLTSTDESNFLQTISTPMQTRNGSFDKVYANLNPDHETKILAYASGRGFSEDIPTSVTDLKTVLEKYPTPVEFQSIEDELLDSIRRAPKNSPQMVIEYQKDFASFKQKFYGKRQQYHEAWQKLVQEAQDYQTLHNPHLDTPEERDQKIREGRYAQYFYPEEDLGYQAPEQQARWLNPDYQPDATDVGNQPNARLSNHTSINSNHPELTQPKQSFLGKLFGRKK